MQKLEVYSEKKSFISKPALSSRLDRVLGGEDFSFFTFFIFNMYVHGGVLESVDLN